MQTLQIQNLSVDELKVIIEDTIENKVSSLIPKPQPQVKYLTRQETADHLRISLVTLHDWTKKGIIKAYRINSRVRFKSDEVENAVKEIHSLKYRRDK